MSLQKRWSHEARYLPEPSSIVAARDFVTAQLLRHELAYLIDDVRLVTSELVTNAERHAGSAFFVSLESLPTCVRLSVRDDAAAAPLLRIETADGAGGRGLAAVERLSTAWGITRTPTGGKSVWASFALRSVR